MQSEGLGFSGSKRGATNLDVIRLRNAASVSPLTQRNGLGALDLDALQQAADAYRKLGLIEHPIQVSDVAGADLLPTPKLSTP